uniref:Uncharacterized protein n=1 Tax=Pinctada fucata TaxID=50426 RepID=L8B367_PINFU|nr:hypothetical protein [Pinctada fucata]
MAGALNIKNDTGRKLQLHVVLNNFWEHREDEDAGGVYKAPVDANDSLQIVGISCREGTNAPYVGAVCTKIGPNGKANFNATIADGKLIINKV